MLGLAPCAPLIPSRCLDHGTSEVIFQIASPQLSSGPRFISYSPQRAAIFKRCFLTLRGRDQVIAPVHITLQIADQTTFISDDLNAKVTGSVRFESQGESIEGDETHSEGNPAGSVPDGHCDVPGGCDAYAGVLLKRTEYDETRKLDSSVRPVTIPFISHDRRHLVGRLFRIDSRQ